MKIVVSKTKNFLKNDHSHPIFFEIKSKFPKKHEKDRHLPVHLSLENTLKRYIISSVRISSNKLIQVTALFHLIFWNTTEIFLIPCDKCQIIL